MKPVVARKVPEIVLITTDELGIKDLLRMEKVYHTTWSEFVVYNRGSEVIYVNKSLACVREIVPIINKIMVRKYIDKRTEELFNRFSALAGKKAEGTLWNIWCSCGKALRDAEIKEQAEDILARINEEPLSKHLRGRKELIEKVFDIGFGMYREESKCDWRQGAEKVFLYGYLCCLDSMGGCL